MAIMAILGLTSTLLVLQPLQVDFKLQAGTEPSGIPIQLSPQPQQADPTVVPATQPPQPPRPLLAKGFGEDVPLEFAVRQIVPHFRHVVYTASVDRTLRVSWQGGRPWRQVLRGVLSPIGLHVLVSDNAVQITN